MKLPHKLFWTGTLAVIRAVSQPVILRLFLDNAVSAIAQPA